RAVVTVSMSLTTVPAIAIIAAPEPNMRPYSSGATVIAAIAINPKAVKAMFARVCFFIFITCELLIAETVAACRCYHESTVERVHPRLFDIGRRTTLDTRNPVTNFLLLGSNDALVASLDFRLCRSLHHIHVVVE